MTDCVRHTGYAFSAGAVKSQFALTFGFFVLVRMGDMIEVFIWKTERDVSKLLTCIQKKSNNKYVRRTYLGHSTADVYTWSQSCMRPGIRCHHKLHSAAHHKYQVTTFGFLHKTWSWFTWKKNSVMVLAIRIFHKRGLLAFRNKHRLWESYFFSCQC